MTNGTALQVVVDQTLSGMTVTPGNAGILDGDGRQFSATGIDQFGDDMALSGVKWSRSGDTGEIGEDSGYYSAPQTCEDTDLTITANYDGPLGTADGSTLRHRLPMLACFVHSVHLDASSTDYADECADKRQRSHDNILRFIGSWRSIHSEHLLEPPHDRPQSDIRLFPPATAVGWQHE